MDEGLLLELQHSAGNAAVGRALARARKVGAEEADPAPSPHHSTVHDVLRSAGRPLDVGVHGAPPAAAVEPGAGGHAHGEPTVQRSPSTWLRSDAYVRVNQLAPGMGKSFWTPVLDAATAYGGVDESDLPRRREALSSVEQAIDAWRQNQRQGSRFLRRASLSDAKATALSGLEAAMADERAEIEGLTRARSQPAAPPPRTVPMAIPGRGTAPIAIPGAGRRTPEESSPEYDDGTPLTPFPEVRSPDMAALAALRNAEPLPSGVTVNLHLTGDDNARKIHKDAIRPSRGRHGIGLADTNGEPDRSHFYVITGSNVQATNAVSAEAGGRRVAVLSGPAVAYDRRHRGDGGSAVTTARLGSGVRHRTPPGIGEMSLRGLYGTGETSQGSPPCSSEHLAGSAQRSSHVVA